MPLTPAEKAALDNEHACLYSPDGRMLWRSPQIVRDGGLPDHEILGTKWQEFVVPEDCERFLSYLASRTETTFTYRSFWPKLKRMATLRCRKIDCRGNWLVATTFVPDEGEHEARGDGVERGQKEF